jgi:nucleoside-diphosphate-sugar epimerase
MSRRSRTSSACAPACSVNEEILITGASGFIGRRVAALLAAQGLRFLAMSSRDGDVADPRAFARLRNHRLRRVVHLAARSYVPDSWQDAEGFERTNVRGTENVLELCRDSGASLVFVSGYVYGNVSRQPIDERVPPAPNNPYARSKHLAEQACLACSREHGVAVTVLRPFNVYGPGQDARFLVPTILRQARGGGAIEVHDLAPRRDWVYVDDVAAAIVAAAREPKGFEVYNIGSGASVSVEELIQRIQVVCDTTLPVRVIGRPRENEIADTVADIAKARRELRWGPATGLDDGLRRCALELEKR